MLALWQNKRIQEENDKSQEKLIALIEKSNEASIISKIIEHEERRMADLEAEMDAFIQNCDPQALSMTLKADALYMTMIAFVCCREEWIALSEP